MHHRSIVLTGASSGIGRALVDALAGPGVRMLLIGRDPERLGAVADAARKLDADVQTALLSVTDAEALSRALLAFDDAGAVDLLIANAGVSSGLGPDRSPEDPAGVRRLLDINLVGAMNTIEPLLTRLIARGAGRIVLMSSLAALRPHADMPSYSASKAGLRAWGISLRGWLRGKGVGVTVVCPGFVTSPMSARHRGPRPFEVSAEHAARLIVRGIERGKSEIVFPLPLAIMVRLGHLLPPALSDFFERRFAATIEPDEHAR